MGVQCAKHASRHGRGLIFGLYLNRDAGILSEGVGARTVTGLYVFRRLLCGGALWGARAKHASRHGRGLAFGLYLNPCRHFIRGRGCKASTGLYVQASPVRRSLWGVRVLSTHRDMVADLYSGCI